MSTEKQILHDYIDMLVKKAEITCGISEDKAATAIWLALMAMIGAEIEEDKK